MPSSAYRSTYFLNNDVTRAVAYKEEVLSCYHIGKFERAIEAFNSYMLLYEELAENENEKIMQQCLITGSIFQENMIYFIAGGCYDTV